MSSNARPLSVVGFGFWDFLGWFVVGSTCSNIKLLFQEKQMNTSIPPNPVLLGSQETHTRSREIPPQDFKVGYI